MPTYAAQIQKNGANIVLPKTSGVGIQIDETTPTFGWRDITAFPTIRGIGATDPAFNIYRGGIRQFQFSVNDEVFVEYHMPHDYVPGSDLYIHWHWSHIATTVTGGTVTWGAEISYSKGHNQAAFSAPITTTVVGNASTTQYQHIITEIDFTNTGGDGTHIDNALMEVDGLILVRCYLSANGITVSGGGVPEPFMHFIDLHYQSNNLATKNKAPNFYT